MRDINSRWPFASIVVASAVLAALALKATLQLADRFPFNADEAIVALMARHILQGKGSLFFYGQAYMGSLDAYLVAAAFGWLGEQVWVIRLVQAILYSGTIITTAMLGRQAFGRWEGGIIAAWLLAVPTVNVTLYTTVSLGGYGEMLLIGNIILLLAFRIGKAAKDARETGWRQVSILCPVFGFFIGLGLWAFGLTLVYSLPASIFVGWILLNASREVPIRRRSLGLAIVFMLGLGGFLAGSAPWGLFAAQHGLGRLVGEIFGEAISGVEGVAWPTQLGRHLLNLVLFGGTVVTGLRPPWSTDWLGVPLSFFALAFWMAVVLSTFAGIQRALFPGTGRKPGFFTMPGLNSGRRSAIASADLNQLETGQPVGEPQDSGINLSARQGILLLAGVGSALSIGFVVTPFGADPSGRYFLPLAIILALFAGRAITRLERLFGRRAFLLIGLVLAFNLWGNLQAAARFPPGLTTQFDAETRLDHRYDAELIAFLKQNDERRGYTTYWVSYPLAFLSGEDLIFVPRLPYHGDLRYTLRDNRYAPYAESVKATDRAAFITVRHPSVEEQLRASFAGLGLAWEEKVIGDYRVFYRLSQKIDPEMFGLAFQPGDRGKP